VIDIALMIEGQDGLNWDRWQRIARTAEDTGFAGLYRSDHFTNPVGPFMDSLECWTSLAWLASHSSRLEFGLNERIAALETVGVERVILNWMDDYDDVKGMAAL
jgi:alkanesulfonate monooxygenase SsuD/methylene tetrahydromethanopterin reductase-like flavin-dependent oxidoreductase (luciferase family)